MLVVAGRKAAFVLLAWLAMAAIWAGQTSAAGPSTRAVYEGEHQLRTSIERINEDLQQIKKAFSYDMRQIYAPLLLDQELGLARVREGRADAVKALVIAEEFATMAMLRYVTQRRTLAGLRALQARLLPQLVQLKLASRFKAWEWLADTEASTASSRLAEFGFHSLDENQKARLYQLMDTRARLRAADDVMTLSSDNMKRILAATEELFVRRPDNEPPRRPGPVSRLLADLMRVYQTQVSEPHRNLLEAYLQQLEGARDLVRDRDEFEQSIDRLIDSEALLVDLNREASLLNLPPTLNRPIVHNAEIRWVPEKLRESRDEIRRVLMEHAGAVSLDSVIRIGPNSKLQDADPVFWAECFQSYFCEGSLAK